MTEQWFHLIIFFYFIVGHQFSVYQPLFSHFKMHSFFGCIFEYQNKVGNVNVYGSKLSIKEMQQITNGSRCGEDGDYIAWSISKYIITGNIPHIFEVEKIELCSFDKTYRFIHGNQRQADAQHSCRRLGNSLMHLPQDWDHAKIVYDFFSVFLTLHPN